MKTTPEHNERMAKLTFALVYPHYVTKVERKGRTKEELHDPDNILENIREKSDIKGIKQITKVYDLPDDKILIKYIQERATGYDPSHGGK